MQTNPEQNFNQEEKSDGVEKIPTDIREWSLIDQRVDLLGRGSFVHELHQKKNTCDDLWCALQKKPQDEEIRQYLNKVWKTFIIELKEKEREVAEEKMK